VPATGIARSNLIGRTSRHSLAGKSPLEFTPHIDTTILLLWLLWLVGVLSGLFVPTAQASELKPATNAAFDRYIRATEAQMYSDAGMSEFLIVDRLPEEQRRSAYEQLRQGEVYIQELRTRERGQNIPVPSGLIHHWVGIIFIPNATLADVLAILHDYNRQAEIYKPDVRQSKVLEQTGDDADLFEQFYSKTIVTVVLNVHFHVVQRPVSATRFESASRSTRITEMIDPDNPAQGERPTGNDHGYMWRLNSYWRIEEKDGGVYVQNESVSLSRSMPVLTAWLIEPFTKSIPRDVLSRTLGDMRRAVEANAAKSKPESTREELPSSSAKPSR
jgi:hypothetical protein